MDSSLSDLFALILLIVCLSANAYFAQIETALTASHRGRLERLAEGGDREAAQALSLLEHAAPPLAMAQAGVTCTSLLMGLGIGLLVAPTFGRFLAKLLPGMEVFAAALVLSILVMTALTLLFGDFLPKQIALQDPEAILMRSHRSIRLLTRLTALPSAALVSVSQGLLLLVGINPENRSSVTEDAVKDLMEQGTEDGTFEKAEQDMVDRIFHMSDQTASALMTPRTQIAWIDLAETRAEQLRVIRAAAHEVFPVAYENLDDFRGVVYAKELLDAILSGAEIDLTAPSAPAAPFHLHDALDTRVAVIRLYPGMKPITIDAHIASGYRGIILEGYGLGSVPGDDAEESFLPTLDRARTRACTIVLTTQCIYDGADISHYEVGVRAAELGVLTGGTLPIEALYARLMQRLAETPEGEMVKKLL